MPFQIIRNDITKVKADVIVNTANPHPVIGSGTDSAIYSAAGEELLLAERKKIGDIAPGKAAATPAFALSAPDSIDFSSFSSGEIPPALLISMISMPSSDSFCTFSFSGEHAAIMVLYSPAVCTIRDSTAIRRLLSHIIRTGFFVFSSRQFSIGSSARTVFIPAMIPVYLCRRE